ncbi:ATP-binding protein [Defluviimonas sp. WL0002]|uniref:ATP-binding protein n=1 Tax=Albidovulum marisflavi TaxID=2984159 RepID=A0ABT2Z885_9RHOB|nr:ATP-binding protein [Defluviimonas sp. WL0002]MCV2867235.1 ATP-binding protein [Defluviimonas sp. WL0002]
MRARSAIPIHRFKARIAARPMDVRRLLHEVLVRFQGKIGTSDAGALELVLAEILNNVVEHAYGAERSGDIEVEVALRNGALDCRVVDWGRPLPNDAIPRKPPPDIDVCREQLPEGGWGWTLIRALARDLAYSRSGDTNHLSLVLPLSFE